MIKFLKLALVAIDFGNIVKSKSQSAVPAGPKTWSSLKKTKPIFLDYFHMGTPPPTNNF